MSIARIEVERKFRQTTTLKRLLQDPNTELKQCIRGKDIGPTQNDTTLSCNRQQDRLMRDTYVDTGDAELEKKGIWIRRRSSRALSAANSISSCLDVEPQRWEGKVRIGGDYTDSQFLELEGDEAIRALIEQHVPSAPLGNLVVTVDLVTHRKTWIVQEASSAAHTPETELRIDLDEVTSSVIGADPDVQFKHEIGELEMTEQIVAGGDGDEGEAAKQEAAESMEEFLGKFMARHVSLFSCQPKPKGKLTAYFEWKAIVVDGKAVGSVRK
jgi:hypothetical protein